MTTLVTGATGHIGANLVRALLARGEKTRALVREGTSTEALDGLDLEIVPGDLKNERSLRDAVDGCDKVYNLAAHITIRAGARKELFETNIVGVRKLLRACKDAGVKRVVHTSSLGAVGHVEGKPCTEDDAVSPFEKTMDYELSKAFGEMEAVRAAVEGQDVTIVNPSAVIGGHDWKPSLVGKTVLDFAHGKVPAYIPGGFDFVPVRDVVDGHLRAMENGRRGDRYILSGELVELDQLFAWLSEDVGRPPPRFKIPPRVMLPVATVQDWIDARFFPHRTPRFNEHSIRLLTSRKHASNDKAQRELGLRPTPIREAFREAVAWFRSAGRITRR